MPEGWIRRRVDEKKGLGWFDTDKMFGSSQKYDDPQYSEDDEGLGSYSEHGEGDDEEDIEEEEEGEDDDDDAEEENEK